jgi:hypothetical protein
VSRQSPKAIELHCAQTQAWHVLPKTIFQTIIHFRPPLYKNPC